MISWFARPRPWFLLASLAVNLFMAGVISAAVVFDPPGSRKDPPPVRYMLENTDYEAKPLIRAAFQSRQAEIDAASTELRMARRDLKNTMKAREVDPETVRLALDRQREARLRLAAVFEDAFVEVLPSLSPEARKALVKRQPPKLRFEF